jgi:hypothetical protein
VAAALASLLVERADPERGRAMSHPGAQHLLVDGDGQPLATETLDAYFHGFSADLFDDPVCGAELRRLAVEDPDLLAAVADVDRSQIRASLARTPAERLRCAVNNWNGIARLRRAR